MLQPDVCSARCNVNAETTLKSPDINQQGASFFSFLVTQLHYFQLIDSVLELRPVFFAAGIKCLQQTFLFRLQLANLLYCENVTTIIVRHRLLQAVPTTLQLMVSKVNDCPK